jgi:hypothetical protein
MNNFRVIGTTTVGQQRSNCRDDHRSSCEAAEKESPER